MKKTKKQSPIKNERVEPFKIKYPTWTLGVGLLATVGFFLAFLHTLDRYPRDPTPSALTLCIIFPLLSMAGAAGVYCSIWEKLTYAEGVYEYSPPFRKKQIAKIEDIHSVKILVQYYRTRYGRDKRIRILFRDRDKKILIKIRDDGTLSENEIFLKSLKAHRIKLIREEKHDY